VSVVEDGTDRDVDVALPVAELGTGAQAPLVDLGVVVVVPGAGDGDRGATPGAEGAGGDTALSSSSSTPEW
jgi:hypothetical protein